MDFSKELALYKTAREKEVEEEEKAKARRNFKATRCFYGKDCIRHRQLRCSFSHGTSDADLTFCKDIGCVAWWCGKSHPARQGNQLPDIPELRTPPSTYVCRRCKVAGHYIQDCPENVCDYCRDKGHIASKCPVRVHFYKRKRSREESSVNEVVSSL